MGTFAHLFCDETGSIPESKKAEFIERIGKLFHAGGMMNVTCVHMYEKKIPMFHKVTIHNDEMVFRYNYFEDDAWEDAGFNKDNCYIWSGKIGWSHFRLAMISAYVLKELYYDGVAVTHADGETITSWAFVGWINYLFNEKYHVKNFDPWKLFETLHYCDGYEKEYLMDFDFGNTRYAFIGRCEIDAILNGIQDMIQRYDSSKKDVLEEAAFDNMRSLITQLKKYKDLSTQADGVQLKELKSIIRAYYETDNPKFYNSPADELLKNILIHLFFCDAPALAIKTISELYNKDFWELWDTIKDVVHRKSMILYNNNDRYVLPLPTHKLFHISQDDMIYYWEENGDIEFSPTLLKWFDSLKKQYDEIAKSEFYIKHPLKYIINLLDEAYEEYYQICTFAEFFEETIEHLNDARYLSLWKLFDQMVHDPELKKAGDVIFVPDGPEHENEGLHYWGEQPKRRLTGYWHHMESNKKFNKARQTLRRYLALVANKPLRYKVFGF